MSDNKLKRRLNFNDMFFTGVSYMIGAGIFTLMPFIIKYGGKNAWVAFLIGGIIRIRTGLSFARLNFQYPVNDAEYSWIREIFKGKDEKEPNSIVNWFATIVIWVVGIMGIFAKSTVALGLAEFIETYNLGIPKHVITFLALGIPTLINSLGVKIVANVAKTVIILVICAFLIIITSIFKYNKYLGDNKINLDTNNLPNILRSSFITIFAFSGFQSVVQLSEETISKDIIPKSITASVIFTTIFYAFLIISVVGIIGLKKAKSTIYPISEAYNVIFGSKGRNVVTLLSIITMFSTLVIGILGVSRLFQKLSVKGIAPKYLSKLISLDILFKSKEDYKNEDSVNKNEDSVNKNEDSVNKNEDSDTVNDKSTFDKMPIPALLTVFILSFVLTFVKGGVLELMANATNSMLFFIFTIVNLLVIVNYFKTKNDEPIKAKDKTIKGFLNIFPWYACIGFVLSLIFLIISPQYYKLN